MPLSNAHLQTPVQLLEESSPEPLAFHFRPAEQLLSGRYLWGRGDCFLPGVPDEESCQEEGGSASFIPGPMWKGRGRMQLSLGEACQSLQLLGSL